MGGLETETTIQRSERKKAKGSIARSGGIAETEMLGWAVGLGGWDRLRQRKAGVLRAARRKKRAAAEVRRMKRETRMQQERSRGFFLGFWICIVGIV